MTVETASSTHAPELWPPNGLDDFLNSPAAYPNLPERVSRIETHASVVYLAGDEVYKRKKPVDFGFLNYATLERRKLMCHLEVQLNQRLAPDIYLGVKPVTRGNHHVQIDGAGDVIDYLVHMRRLPEEAILAALVDEDNVNPAAIDAIAERIGSFHRTAARSPEIDRWGLPAAIRKNVEENFDQTRSFVGRALARPAFNTIATYSRSFLTEHRGVLNERVLDGMVRDGHGDIRCDHVYLLDDIAIVDCIEFNDRLRYGDVASDIGFLAMDLDARNRPDLSDRLISTYVAHTGFCLAEVLDFYRCYRAYVRGKVALFSLDTQANRRHLRDARRFFHLAHRYASGSRGPRLILMSGLTGSGKSTLASELGRILPATVVDSDSARKRLAGLALAARQEVAFNEGIYSPAHSRRVYEDLLKQAESDLAKGRSMILDATYSRLGDRKTAEDLASRHGAEFLVAFCDAPADVVRERLGKRSADPSRVSDGRWEIYLKQRESFEQFAESERSNVLQIDSRLPIDDQAQAILNRLERKDPAPI